MSKMSVKKVTGVMILSLSFGVSAALMSPFGGVFAGRHGKNGKGTQGSSENNELQSEKNQAQVKTPNATFDVFSVDDFSVDDFPVDDFPVDDFSVDDFPVDDFPVSLMDTNANTVGANLGAQNVAAVAAPLRQNFGPVSDVSGEFNNQIGNQVQNKNTKPGRGRSAELTEAGRNFRKDIAQFVFGSPDGVVVNKKLVIKYCKRAIDELEEQGIQISAIPRKYSRSINLFYNYYAQYSTKLKLLWEMKRLVIEDMEKTLNPQGA